MRSANSVVDESASVQTLRRAHAAKITRTTGALASAILQLTERKPGALWSVEDLWRAAGLKSGNALKNPRHNSFLGLIELHNDGLLAKGTDVREKISSPSSREKLIRSLQDRVVALKTERDKALQLNGLFQREADYHAAENRDLLEKVRQIMEDRDAWKNKFVSNWQRKAIDETK
jgi:hypothetical protein